MIRYRIALTSLVICTMSACSSSAASLPATTRPTPTATTLPTPEPMVAVWATTGEPDRFDLPDGLATDRAGNVYVTDSGNDRVQKLDPDGKFVLTWGASGKAEGQFDCRDICMVAVDAADNVYVTDNGNDRIQKFDSSGTFLAAWGGPGRGEGQFNGPFGIAVDSQGNVYVGDVGNQRIQKLDRNGAFVLEFGSVGGNEGQFSPEIADIAVDAAGHIFVTDRGRALQEFDVDGRYLRTLSTCGIGNATPMLSTTGLAFDREGSLSIFDLGQQRVCTLGPDGRFLREWNGSGSPQRRLDSVGGLAIDRDGNVFVAELFLNQVRKFRQR